MRFENRNAKVNVFRSTKLDDVRLEEVRIDGPTEIDERKKIMLRVTLINEALEVRLG